MQPRHPIKKQSIKQKDALLEALNAHSSELLQTDCLPPYITYTDEKGKLCISAYDKELKEFKSIEDLPKKNPHFGIASWLSEIGRIIMWPYLKIRNIWYRFKGKDEAGHKGDFETPKDEIFMKRITKAFKANSLGSKRNLEELLKEKYNNSCRIKWVDQKELDSYYEVKKAQDQGLCLSVFPKIFGVFKETDEDNHPKKPGFVIMQNVGSNLKSKNDPKIDIIDIKLGFKTVTTQEKDKGTLGTIKKWWKKFKNTGMDMFFGSKERGFRIETRKFMYLNEELNIDFRTLFGENAKPELFTSMIESIDKIIDEFVSGRYKNKTFISSSILIGITKDRSACDVKLIDLAHPLTEEDIKPQERFEEYRNNFLFGLKNLRTQLKNYKQKLMEMRTQTDDNNDRLSDTRTDGHTPKLSSERTVDTGLRSMNDCRVDFESSRKLYSSERDRKEKTEDIFRKFEESKKRVKEEFPNRTNNRNDNLFHH